MTAAMLEIIIALFFFFFFGNDNCGKNKGCDAYVNIYISCVAAAVQRCCRAAAAIDKTPSYYTRYKVAIREKNMIIDSTNTIVGYPIGGLSRFFQFSSFYKLFQILPFVVCTTYF